MRSNDPSAKGLVSRLGAHPATRLGLDLDGDDAQLGAWLVACVLLGGRTREDAALAAFGRLRARAAHTPAAACALGPDGLQPLLEASAIPKSEAVAAVLFRVCRGLVRDYEGNVERLARRAESLEDLAARLGRLGAGFGGAGVMRFLTPLRQRWSLAHDLPASPAVAAAAEHLGLVADRSDVESAPAAIARWLRDEHAPPDVPAAGVRDVEAALDRLGRAACLRERSDRCPLDAACPRRGPGGDET